MNGGFFSGVPGMPAHDSAPHRMGLSTAEWLQLKSGAPTQRTKREKEQLGTACLRFFLPAAQQRAAIGILAGIRPPGHSSYIRNIIGTQMRWQMQTQDHISSCARHGNWPSCTCKSRKHQHRLTGGNKPQPAEKANARIRKKIGST